MSFFGSDSKAQTSQTQVGASDQAQLASWGGAIFNGGGSKKASQYLLWGALAVAALWVWLKYRKA